MKIRFCCDNGANIHSKKTEEFTPKDLGYTEGQWRDLSDDVKIKEATDWANEHIEIWFEEVEE